MESENSGEENEKKQSKESNEKQDFSCFGEYGSRWNCETCQNAGTCKNFSHEKKDAIYRKQKSKYRGKGKWSRKDLY